MVSSIILVSVFISFVMLFYIHTSFKRNFINVYHWPFWLTYLVDFVILFSTSFRFIFRAKPELLQYRFFYYVINTSYVLLGFVGLLILMVIILDLEHLFHIASRKYISNKNQHSEGRRAFLKKSITLSGLATAGTITGLGIQNSFDPKIVKVKIPLDQKFKKLNGLKIAQLSDVHIGPTLQKDFAEKITKMVNELGADLIVITGDLVDGDVATTGQDVLPIKNLKAPMGTYYITGNHEYYWNKNEWTKFVETLGIKNLHNENVVLKFKDFPFALCGVPDIHAKKIGGSEAPNFLLAKKDLNDEIYKILLSHQPVTCFESVKAGYHLQLSGHTHGGQGFPWNFIVRLVQPYIKGLYNHEGMQLYVHSGTGFWGPPNRFMINSEITLIELEHIV